MHKIIHMKDKIHYLYLITRLDGEQYVGVTTNINKRMYSHKYGTGNKYLSNTIFSYEIILEGSEDYIYSVEDYYIKKYNCSLNVAKGGNKGPHLSGEAHGYAILTSLEVLEIRDLLNDKTLSYSDIGSMYGVSGSTISNIANGTAWKDTGTFTKTLRKPAKIGEEDKLRVLELWNLGTPRSEIVKITGVKKTSVYTLTKDIIPDNPTRHANALDSSTVDTILELYKEIKDINKVANMLGLSKTTVKKYTRETE